MHTRGGGTSQAHVLRPPPECPSRRLWATRDPRLQRAWPPHPPLSRPLLRIVHPWEEQGGRQAPRSDME
jgi:hypothetical protein